MDPFKGIDEASLDRLSGEYLERLRTEQCQPDEQKLACMVLTEKIRRLENGWKATNLGKPITCCPHCDSESQFG